MHQVALHREDEITFADRPHGGPRRRPDRAMMRQAFCEPVRIVSKQSLQVLRRGEVAQLAEPISGQAGAQPRPEVVVCMSGGSRTNRRDSASKTAVMPAAPGKVLAGQPEPSRAQ